ncbi:MAG: hypothetical protein L0H94_11370 [Nitrospira sp.]|nr:hypothetical protein [Nitrospira sp.]
MGKVYPAMAVLVLALLSLAGYESQAHGETNIVRVAEMQKTLRELWLGHIFKIQHVVLYNQANNPAERHTADKQVLVNAKQIADTFAPFYGEARSEKLFTLLSGHYAAVKAYSEATIGGNAHQQDTALAHLASNADEIDAFFNGVNPQHLPKNTIRGLIAAHGAHHVLQINQYKKKEYAKLDETWPMMRQHVYIIADTLTMALSKQFPEKFS